MSHQQAANSVAGQLANQTAAAGAGASALLTLLPGGRIIERVLASGGKNVAGGVVRGAARGFVGESVNEGLDEAASRVAANVAVQQVDPSRATSYGVGEAAGLGAVMGGVMGIVVGSVFAYVVTTRFGGEGISFSLPVVQLLIFLALAIVVGVLAAILPARRAARIDILEAIHYE
jgi:hypothetical protein